MTMFSYLSAPWCYSGTRDAGAFFIFFHGDIREDMENTLKNTQQEYREKIQFIQDGGGAIRHNAVLKKFFTQSLSDREEMEKQLLIAWSCFRKEIWQQSKSLL